MEYTRLFGRSSDGGPRAPRARSEASPSGPVDVPRRLVYDDDVPIELRYGDEELSQRLAATKIDKKDRVVRRVDLLRRQAEALDDQLFVLRRPAARDADGQRVDSQRFVDGLVVAANLHKTYEATRRQPLEPGAPSSGPVTLGPQPTDSEVHNLRVALQKFLTDEVDFADFTREQLGTMRTACESLGISVHPNGAATPLGAKLAVAANRLRPRAPRLLEDTEEEKARLAAQIALATVGANATRRAPVTPARGTPQAKGAKPASSPGSPGAAALVSSAPLDAEVSEILLRLCWNPRHEEFESKVENLFASFDACAKRQSRSRAPARDAFQRSLKIALASMSAASLAKVTEGVAAVRAAAANRPAGGARSHGFRLSRQPRGLAPTMDPRFDIIERAVNGVRLYTELKERQALIAQRIDEPDRALAQDRHDRRTLRYILGPNASAGLRRAFAESVQQTGQHAQLEFLDALAAFNQAPTSQAAAALVRTFITYGTPSHLILPPQLVGEIERQVAAQQPPASADALRELFVPARREILRWLQAYHLPAFIAQLKEAAQQ